jgi:hypothetical protein
MADLGSTDERLVLIRERQADAALLLMRVHHDEMRELVRMASRELEEALGWLATKDVDSNPSVLKVVDCLTSLTTCRLAVVDEVLKAHGPDAKLTE